MAGSIGRHRDRSRHRAAMVELVDVLSGAGDVSARIHGEHVPLLASAETN